MLLGVRRPQTMVPMWAEKPTCLYTKHHKSACLQAARVENDLFGSQSYIPPSLGPRAALSGGQGKATNGTPGSGVPRGPGPPVWGSGTPAVLPTRQEILVARQSATCRAVAPKKNFFFRHHKNFHQKKKNFFFLGVGDFGKKNPKKKIQKKPSQTVQ